MKKKPSGTAVAICSPANHQKRQFIIANMGNVYFTVSISTEAMLSVGGVECWGQAPGKPWPWTGVPGLKINMEVNTLTRGSPRAHLCN